LKIVRHTRVGLGEGSSPARSSAELAPIGGPGTKRNHPEAEALLLNKHVIFNAPLMKLMSSTDILQETHQEMR